MKKTYNAPAAKIVKIHPRSLMTNSLTFTGTSAKGITKTADSRSLRYDIWDDGGDYNGDYNDEE